MTTQDPGIDIAAGQALLAAYQKAKEAMLSVLRETGMTPETAAKALTEARRILSHARGCWFMWRDEHGPALLALAARTVAAERERDALRENLEGHNEECGLYSDLARCTCDGGNRPTGLVQQRSDALRAPQAAQHEASGWKANQCCIREMPSTFAAPMGAVWECAVCKQSWVHECDEAESCQWVTADQGGAR